MKFGLREIIFLMVLLAIPIASYFVVFKPNNEQISMARKEIELKRTRLSELHEATKHIDDLGKEIEKLRKAISLFEAKLPAEKEVDVILSQVWTLAKANNLRPRSVRTQKLVKNARYVELPINMVIKGDFDGFYNFLLGMERLSRITRVPDMKLAKLKNIEGQMEATFTLSIFFEPPKSPGGAPAPAPATPAAPKNTKA